MFKRREREVQEQGGEVQDCYDMVRKCLSSPVEVFPIEL